MLNGKKAAYIQYNYKSEKEKLKETSKYKQRMATSDGETISDYFFILFNIFQTVQNYYILLIQLGKERSIK